MGSILFLSNFLFLRAEEPSKVIAYHPGSAAFTETNDSPAKLNEFCARPERQKLPYFGESVP